MRKIFAAILILVFAAKVFAIGLDRLDMKVAVSEDGQARITENYTIKFSSPFEFEDFREEARQNSSSLLAWQADYNFFFPHFGDVAGNTLKESAITFDDSTRIVTLEYELQNGFARLAESEQRTDRFEVSDRQFAAFIQAGTIDIPENIYVEIIVPPNSQIETKKLPAKVVVSGNRILLNGIQSNSISIGYEVFKPIAPRSDEIVEGISNTLLFAPIAIIILALVYAKRETIERRIEDYLVEHSEIKKRDFEHETDFDFEK